MIESQPEAPKNPKEGRLDITKKAAAFVSGQGLHGRTPNPHVTFEEALAKADQIALDGEKQKLRQRFDQIRRTQGTAAAIEETGYDPEKEQAA